ncbi:type I methionyl aminopeptidase [Cohnella sp. CFH 77786]|uniref:type I methionyl aminopeptidase n=1 Tax=Cohnella sp. CFH 77786 TaxID=2662265 RepID=UPI001C6088A9|nr:type I methionyl aminopeptidase [Cohnella sp. CFH 77786]MBW5445474.1 type I methionyl aminopeptidase [Cohnella sp. CFH 77786]
MGSGVKIPTRTAAELEGIRAAARVAAGLRKALRRLVAPGVTTMELNDFADRYMRERGAVPAQVGYRGYPYAICAAVNEVICHGMPDGRALREGDLVTLDFVVELDGWHADTAYTYAVGRVSEEAERLRKAAYAAMMKGIAQVRPGRRTGDIADAIMRTAAEGGYGVVAEFGGHGIGRRMHEPPEVPSIGKAGRGSMLKAGMVLTVEPMLTIGSPEIEIAQDGWTVSAKKGGWAAQFEHTVAVSAEGPVILTRL